jgi:hypothetical protein
MATASFLVAVRGIPAGILNMRPAPVGRSLDPSPAVQPMDMAALPPGIRIPTLPSYT